MNETMLRRHNDSKSKDDFIKGTNSHIKATTDNQSWDNLNPNAEYDKNIKGSMVNVKFNEWELKVLKHLAKKDNRSLNMYLKLLFKEHAMKEVENII